MSKSSLAEENRLEQARSSGMPWKKWGPYLAERQWGTVREDYSENGNDPILKERLCIIRLQTRQSAPEK